jgi:hypothetical protein
MSDEEALSDEGNEDFTEDEQSPEEDLPAAGGKKIKFRRNVPWIRIATFGRLGKSEEELQAMVLQVATDQLKPYIPDFFQELKPLDTDLFGWKRKEIYVARKVQQIATYRCPLAYACQCKSMLRVVRTEEHIVVEIKEEHNSESHANDTYKKLKAKHKSALVKIVRADPSLSSTAVRRQIHQAEDVPVELHRSVQHLVRKERLQVISSEFRGVTLDGSLGSFHSLKDSMWFRTAIDRWVNLFGFSMSR